MRSHIAAFTSYVSGRHADVSSVLEMVDYELTVELPAPSSGGPLRIFVPRTFLDSKVTGRGWRWERKKALEASKVPPQLLR